MIFNILFLKLNVLIIVLAKEMSNRMPTKCESNLFNRIFHFNYFKIISLQACKLFALELNKQLKKIETEGLEEKNFDYESVVEKSSKQFEHS